MELILCHWYNLYTSSRAGGKSREVPDFLDPPKLQDWLLVAGLASAFNTGWCGQRPSLQWQAALQNVGGNEVVKESQIYTYPSTVSFSQKPNKRLVFPKERKLLKADVRLPATLL